MIDYSMQNKKAWEYNAYDFWVRQAGTPADLARKILTNPVGALKRYAAYFDTYQGVRIANICGSCGKKAVPLAVLGAEVTVFDISEDNRRYALELAEASGVCIDYQVCDVLEIDLAKYGGSFDVVFMEGGVLHYFHDLAQFMGIMYALLKPEGRMICSDFHPFTKVQDTLDLQQPTMSFFPPMFGKAKWPTPDFTAGRRAGNFPSAATGNTPSARSSTPSSPAVLHCAGSTSIPPGQTAASPENLHSLQPKHKKWRSGSPAPPQLFYADQMSPRRTFTSASAGSNWPEWRTPAVR